MHQSSARQPHTALQGLKDLDLAAACTLHASPVSCNPCLRPAAVQGLQAEASSELRQSSAQQPHTALQRAKDSLDLAAAAWKPALTEALEQHAAEPQPALPSQQQQQPSQEHQVVAPAPRLPLLEVLSHS